MNKLFCIFLFVVGMYLVPIKIMGPDFDNVPGDFADGRLNNYFLEHAYLYFTGKTNSYWSAPFMYPEIEVITYSDNLLGTAPVYFLFRVLDFDRESAFQGWILVLFALNFITATYALNKLTGNLWLSAIGGYIFSFSLPIIGQMDHAQVFPRFIVPLTFLWLIQFFRTRKVIHFVRICVGIVFQFYAGIYLGFMLSLCILFCILVYLFSVEGRLLLKEFKLREIIQLLLTIVGSSILLTPLLYPYYQRSLISGTRSYEEVIASIPYMQSYFFSWNGSFAWPFLSNLISDVPAYWDHYLFPGGIVMISWFLFPIVAYLNRKSIAWREQVIIYISLFLILLFTTQYEGKSLYRYIYQLPGFSSMRAVGRMIHIELFLFAYVATMVFTLVYNKLKYKYLFLFILTALCIMDQYVVISMKTYSKSKSQQRIALVKEQLMQQNIKAYNAFACLRTSVDEPLSHQQLDAMLASQDLSIATVNAYTATSPFEYNAFWVNMDQKSLQEWLASRKMDIKKDKILVIKTE